MSDQGNAPLTLLGSNISYFTGKMENYLRLKQIPYRLESMQFPAVRKVLEREVEVMQMPAIVLPDVCWHGGVSGYDDSDVFTIGRFRRIADGPDEVHMSQVGKLTARELAS